MSKSYSDYYAASIFGESTDYIYDESTFGNLKLGEISRGQSAISSMGPSIWNSKKYNPPSGSENRFNNFIDLSDVYALQGAVISFMEAAGGGGLEFKAFITAFNETYSVDWASEQVFGRTDPIQTFKQVTRNCTLSFVVPASTTGEAFENLGRVDYLLSLIYPSYENSGNALTIANSPLVRINVANLLRKDTAVGFTYEEVFSLPGSLGESIESYDAGSDTWSLVVDTYDAGSGTDGHYRLGWGDGALCAINSISINHNLESDSGVAHGRQDIKMVLPKLIEVAMDFTVIHEKTMGPQTDRQPPPPSGGRMGQDHISDGAYDYARPGRYGVDLYRQDAEALQALARAAASAEDEDDESAASQAAVDGEIGRTGAAMMDNTARATHAAYGSQNHRGQSYIPSFTDGGTINGSNYYDYAVETHYQVGLASGMSDSDARGYGWHQTWEDMSRSRIGDGTQAAVTEDAVREYYENVSSSPVRQSDGDTDSLPAE